MLLIRWLESYTQRIGSSQAGLGDPYGLALWRVPYSWFPERLSACLEPTSIRRLVIRTSPRICVHSETMLPTTCPHLPPRRCP